MIGHGEPVPLEFVSPVGVLDGAHCWGREEHDAAVHPPPEVIGGPGSGTVLKAPPEAALEAPRSRLTPLELPVLFFPLTPTFLGIGAHHRRHGARDHQAHANPLANVPHCRAGPYGTGPGGGGGGGPVGGGGGGGAIAALIEGGGGKGRRVYAGW